MSSPRYEQKFNANEGFASQSDSQFKDELQHKKNLLKRIKSGQKGISAFEQDLLSRHQRNGQTIDSQKENSNMISNRASNSNAHLSSPGVANRFQGLQDNHNPMMAYAARGSAGGSFAPSTGGQAMAPGTLRYTNSQQALINNQRFEGQIDSGARGSGDVMSLQYERGVSHNQLNTFSNDHRVPENTNQYHQPRSRGGNSGQFPSSRRVEQMDKRSIVNTEDEDRIQRTNYSKEFEQPNRNSYGYRSQGGSSVGSAGRNIQQNMSPPRQSFDVPRETSSNRGQYVHRRADSLERQALQSVPLRVPSGSSRSPVLTSTRNAVAYQNNSQYTNDTRAQRLESLRNSHRSPSSSMSPTSRISSHQKLQQYPSTRLQQQHADQFGVINQSNIHTKNHSPIYPIQEQDTTQEISSIDPHGISANQKEHLASTNQNQNGYYVTVNNDESQYVFTSAQHSQSIVVDQPSQNIDQFQFNSGALADSDQKGNNNSAQFRENQPHYQVEAGELSEPRLETAQNIQSNSKTEGVTNRTGVSAGQVTGRSQDFRDQITKLVRHDEYGDKDQEQNQQNQQNQQKHHAGGSFGNLKEFGLGAGDQNQNSIANLQKMLDPQSHKINGEYTSGQTEAFGSIRKQESFDKRHQNLQTQPKNKVKIIISDGVEEPTNLDSSIEFKHRKYNIIKNISSDHQRRKSRGTLESKRNSRQNKQQSDESEPVNQKAKKRHEKKRSMSGSREKPRKTPRKARSSSNSKNDSSDKSDTDSDFNHNDSQVSLSQKSRDSYGKYFMRSRSKNNHSRSKSRKGSAKRNRSKKNSKKGDRSILKSGSKPRERLTRDKRSKSISQKRNKSQKSRSKSLSKDYISMKKINGSMDVRGSSRKSRSRNTSRSVAKMTLSKEALMSRGTTGSILGKPSNSISTPHSLKKAQYMATINHAVRPPISGYTYRPSQMSTIQPFAQLSTIDSVSKKRNSASRTIQTHGSSLMRNKKLSISKTRRSDKGGDTSNSVLLDPKSGETLAQRLLIDLAKKYRSMGEKQGRDLQHHFNGHGPPGVAKAQQQQLQQMIQEIQSLAVALIKSEKRISKTKAEKSQMTKKFKGIIEDQEECIALLQQKVAKLDHKLDKMQRNEVQLSHDMQRGEQKVSYELADKDQRIRELEKRLNEGKNRSEQEKREIIITMERDLQQQAHKMVKKNEIKMNSLKSVNDQLNVRCQELGKIEKAHDKLCGEYNQSLQILNEFQEKINQLSEENNDLKAQNSDLQLQQDHNNTISQDKISELTKKLEQMQSRHEQRITALKKEQQCELQKHRISQGVEEDSQRYQFEEEITNLKMQVKKKDETLEENQNQIDALQNQIDNERADHQISSEQISDQLKQSEEQRERIELEAKDLETQVQHLQRVIQQKDEEIGQYSSQPHLTQVNVSATSDMEKDNLINQLQMQLEKSQMSVNDLSTKLNHSEKLRQMDREESDNKNQSLQSKIDLQQQEIHILAQGFQAQQMKLNQLTNHGASTGNFSGLAARNNIKVDDPHQSSVQSMSSLGGPGPNQDIKDVVRSARDRNSAMNIQSNYTYQNNHTSNTQRSSNNPKKAILSRNDASSQQQTEGGISSSDASESGGANTGMGTKQNNLYFQGNNYQDNRNQIIAEAHQQARLGLDDGSASKESSRFINTCSLSSTGKQLEFMGASASNIDYITASKFQQMRAQLPPKCNNLLIQDHDQGNDCQSNIEEESTPASSTKNDFEGPHSAYKDQINQKDEEIKVLWSVISKMREGSSEKQAAMLTLGSFGGLAGDSIEQSTNKFLQNSSQQLTGKLPGGALNHLVNVGHAYAPSGGNQSSIMGINGPFQYLTGESAASAQMQSELNSLALSGTRGRNLEQNSGLEHLTEPALVDKQQDLRQSKDSVKSTTSKQELIDVKKRIQALMGPKPSGSKSSAHNTIEGLDGVTQKSHHQARPSNGESSARISKFASGVESRMESEGIEEYFQNKKV